MGPIEYKARILPDGHLPLPPELAGHPGEEVNVRVELAELPILSEEEVRRRNDRLFSLWVGIVKEGPSDLAENHDAYLYGDR